MSNTITAETTVTEDAITIIAREIAAAALRRDACEIEAMQSDELRAGALHRAEDEHDDRIRALRDMLTHRQATTLAGAAVQLCELTNRFGVFGEQYPEAARTDAVDEDRRAIERLAFSVLDVLAKLTGQPADVIVYPGFSDQHLNPWISPAETIGVVHV